MHLLFISAVGHNHKISFTWERLKEATVLSSYSRMLMVSRAHVLSASRPDFRDIITRQASGIPGIKVVGFFGTRKEKKVNRLCLNDNRDTEQRRLL